MIYLSSFRLPSKEQEEDFFFSHNPKNFRTCYTTKYPFGMFRDRGLPRDFIFEDITIICGNNGSGKSTILNVIAEKLDLKRSSPFNRSDFSMSMWISATMKQNSCFPLTAVLSQVTMSLRESSTYEE